MTMSRKELAEQQAKIAQQIEESFKADVAAWIARGEELAKEAGLSMQVFVERHALNANAKANASAPRRGVAPAKYVSPNDPTVTWSGKGKAPAWFADAIKQGYSPGMMEVATPGARGNGAHA